MKRTVDLALKTLLAVLFLAGPLQAQGGAGPLKADAPEEGNSLYVGHYGETFQYSYGWVVSAGMRAETEFVRLQPRLSRRDELLERYPRAGVKAESKLLKDSDFTAENFTPKNLLELVVIPKDAPGGYKSLRKIRRAKEREMSAHGLDYEIGDRCGYGQQFDFPPGSFQVWIKRPYRLFQCYSESPQAFFILTSGDPPTRAADKAGLLMNRETVEFYLARHLASVNPPEKPEIDLRGFKGFWRAWLFMNGPLLLLMALPGSNRLLQRLNFIGYNLMLFINIAGLIGFLIPCISYRTGWGTWRTGDLMLAIPAILGPWICRLIARRFYSADEQRVFWWSWLAAVPLAAGGLEGYFINIQAPPEPVFEIISLSTFICATIGMAFGLIFSFVVTLPDRNREKTPASLLLLLLAFAVSPAMAMDPSDAEALASTPAQLTRRLLNASKGGHDYREDAVESLKQLDEYFDRQRVEVTGLWSSDDTYEQFPKMFDGQVKTSFFAGRSNSTLLDRINNLRKYIFGVTATDDINNFLTDNNGNLSDRGKEVLKEYEKLKINEIVAHSWGSELIYNAILSRYIQPPKKLIVVGVPDNLREKWDLLARFTGTEVHFCRSKDDYAAMWGAKVSEVANRLASPWAPRGDLLSRWVDYSGMHRGHGPADWSAHAIVEDVDTIPGLLGHDRLAYYDLLQGRGILKQTVHALSRLQGRAVEAEIKRQKDADWSIYYNQALNLIADAKKRQSALQEAAVRQQEWVRQIEKNRMRADIQNSLDIMRQMVQSACRDDSGLTADDSGNFLLAFNRLFNYGTDEGYPPNAALNGLSGCAWDLLHELLQGNYRLNPGSAEPANEMAHQAYRQYHQADTTDVDADPGPDPSPHGCGNRQPASKGWGSGSYQPCP